MTQEDFAQSLARDMVDGVLKRAAKPAGTEVESNDEIKIDPETQRKLVEREIKMAADPDFELSELAKRSAADRMRKNMGGSAQGTQQGKTESQIVEEERKRKSDEAVAESTRRMDQAKSIYNSCLEAGGDPARCAKMVADLMEVKQAASAPPATSITELVHSLKELDELRSSKTNPELTEILKEMREEIRSLRSANSAPPPKAADPIDEVERTVTFVKRLREVGLISEPAAASTGKPIEVVKEENRHAEEMEKITIEKAHKESIASTLSEIPGAVIEGVARIGGAQQGAIAAKQVRPGGAIAKREVPVFECPECHNKQEVSPDTTHVVCLKCKQPFDWTPDEQRG